MMKVLLSLMMSCLCAAQSVAQSSTFSQGCSISPQDAAIIAKLHQPEDVRQPEAERQAQKLAELREPLAASPEDIYLNEEYQDVRISQIGDEREAVIAEYETRLAKDPQNPVLLYLAARAEYSQKTPQAIANLKQAIKIAPSFGLPFLLLAQIYSAPAFADPAKVAESLDHFGELCPTSVRTFSELFWAKDNELMSRTASRIRGAIKGRTDIEAEIAYPKLWRLEQATHRSDDQAANRALIVNDAEWLRDSRFPRTADWLTALENASDMTDVPKIQDDADAEIVRLFPNSDTAVEAALEEREKGNPRPKGDATQAQLQSFWKRELEVVLPVAREWPEAEGPAYHAAEAAIADESSTPQQIRDALSLFQFAYKQNPSDIPSVRPLPLQLAQSLVERGVCLEEVPALVPEGLAMSDRMWQPKMKSDISPDAAKTARAVFDYNHEVGLLASTEASIRLGKLSAAKKTLLQLGEKIADSKPADTASSGERADHASLEAQFWYVKGLYAEAENRKLDALIDHRNAIATFPIRTHEADRRDEVMKHAQTLWQQMNGTSEGWNDWAAESSLSSFYAGGGDGSAWSHLATKQPKLILTDALGHQWNPSDLSKKFTFVTLWASWCSPCRAELPYVQKLYERFKDRNDVAVVALNLDDDPKNMDVALKELRLALPSVSARNFAADLVPMAGIPENWIITPSQSKPFEGPSGSLDAWLENATKAFEKAMAR